MERCILCDLPIGIKGFISEDDEGNYVFILNSRLTHEQNIKTAQHEAQHLHHNDLNKEINVADIELDRHFDEK